MKKEVRESGKKREKKGGKMPPGQKTTNGGECEKEIRGSKNDQKGRITGRQKDTSAATAGKEIENTG